MKRNNGFTLLELMITLAIAAILLAVAIPSFKDLVRNNRLANESNRFIGALAFARSEALKRGVRVSLCRSSNAGGSAPECDTSGANSRSWETGWIVFADDSGEGVFNTGETLLAAETAVEQGLRLRSNAVAANFVTFSGNGRTVDAAAPLFALCDDRDGDNDYDETHGREIAVSPVGSTKLKSRSISSCSP